MSDINDRRTGGKILHDVLDSCISLIKPGATGLQVDRIAESMIVSAGGTPAFKGFHGYPSTVCVSFNDTIVHGIPNNQAIKVGDIVSVDVGMKYHNFCTDTAQTVIVTDRGVICASDILSKSKQHQPLSNDEKLLLATYQSLYLAIDQVKPGKHIGVIGSAIQSFVEPQGFSVIRDLVGHGVGESIHEPPNIPNYGRDNEGPIMKVGDALAIEPMLSAGKYDVKVASDGWAMLTKDGSLSAHFEHTIIVTEHGAEILT